MNIKLSLLAIIILSIALAGCASSDTVREQTYRSNLGTATDTDIQRIVPNILSRYNFTIYRDEITLDGIYYETEWKDRDLFDDERALGVTEARSRIYVTARPRTAQASSLHRVDFEVQNQVMIEGEEDWNRETITDEAETYFSEIARTLRVEFESGIRRN
jgi:hypothetical protein